MTNGNILHIYSSQSSKYICKCFENSCQMKKYYIYIFINLQNVYVKVLKIHANRKYITYPYQNISTDICKFSVYCSSRV